MERKALNMKRDKGRLGRWEIKGEERKKERAIWEMERRGAKVWTVRQTENEKESARTAQLRKLSF